ncbi:MarR family winged helix-turn-helix transcriptional regulator [Chitinophaga sp.]|uniref:MarR family winged helix-turn-helix transcriptional regulator n=1 Tax=Chitinophaga sp. TaxID=1869181 RepID=UPI0026338ADD|nr:MarR family winged helix-turn-helix transcriptional regulator [uncultured Chitinophaga sp.]
MNYSLIKQLIDLAEDYDRSAGEGRGDIKDFVRWLKEGQSPENVRTTDHYSDDHVPGLISKLLVYMHRYAKLYFKRALEQRPIQSMDEFGYMVSLLQYGPMNKTALIQQNIQEKPTGMEIINRLVKLGFIEETPDPNDRRSKLIQVSGAGQKMMGELFGDMDKISRLILGDLLPSEQYQLLEMLERLHCYHKPIFQDDLQQLDDLIDKKQG